MRKRKKFDEGELGDHLIFFGLLLYVAALLLPLLLRWNE